jgi:uncharacterized protein YecT (DUF1311 family)
MRIPRLLIVAFASYWFGALMAHALAQAPENGTDCKEAITTAAMHACANERYQKADRELSTVYGELMKRLDKGRQEKLRLAQRAWLRFRDAHADFEGDYARGGTLAPVIKMSALADLTEARVAELRKELQQP